MIFKALIVLILAALPAQGQLMGPLRIRDMTPFNILRLDMPPAPAITQGWSIEAVLSRTNVFMMSDNVKDHLDRRDTDGALTQGDADAIAALGEDSYFVDGEIGLLDLTFQYGFAYVALSVYDFTGGFLDSTVDGFHDSFGLGNAGRDLVARDRFQAVASLQGQRIAFHGPPVDSGLGDPVIGMRHSWPLRSWTLVLDGAAKIALRGERPGLSTGSNDYGLQASLQRKLGRQGIYLSASLVRTDGRVFGVPVGSRVVPTLNAAYEVSLTRRTNAVLQLYASESAIRETDIDEIKANKYQVSLGLRSRRGNLIYGFAVTENVVNFQNTPDIGLSLTLGWTAFR
jgi:hypothetical protein